MPTDTISIPTDDARTIVSASDPEGDYELVNIGSDPIVVNDRKKDALDGEGREIEPGRPVILTKDGDKEAIYATADGLIDGEISIDKTRFSIVKLPPMTLQGGRQNRESWRVETVTTDTQTTMPDLPIPDGYEVSLTADPNNGDVVEVIDPEGGRLPLPAGGGVDLGVTNLNLVSVEPVSGTQTVRATVEV